MKLLTATIRPSLVSSSVGFALVLAALVLVAFDTGVDAAIDMEKFMHKLSDPASKKDVAARFNEAYQRSEVFDGGRQVMEFEDFWARIPGSRGGTVTHENLRSNLRSVFGVKNA